MCDLRYVVVGIEKAGYRLDSTREIRGATNTTHEIDDLSSDFGFAEVLVGQLD